MSLGRANRLNIYGWDNTNTVWKDYSNKAINMSIIQERNKLDYFEGTFVGVDNAADKIILGVDREQGVGLLAIYVGTKLVGKFSIQTSTTSTDMRLKVTAFASTGSIDTTPWTQGKMLRRVIPDQVINKCHLDKALENVIVKDGTRYLVDVNYDPYDSDLKDSIIIKKYVGKTRLQAASDMIKTSYDQRYGTGFWWMNYVNNTSHSGTGTLASHTLTDAGATFLTWGVNIGSIVTIGSNDFFVDAVPTETTLHLNNNSIVPGNGSHAYTVYGGLISTNPGKDVFVCGYERSDINSSPYAFKTYGYSGNSRYVELTSENRDNPNDIIVKGNQNYAITRASAYTKEIGIADFTTDILDSCITEPLTPTQTSIEILHAASLFPESGRLVIKNYKDPQLTGATMIGDYVVPGSGTTLTGPDGEDVGFERGSGNTINLLNRPAYASTYPIGTEVSVVRDDNVDSSDYVVRLYFKTPIEFNVEPDEYIFLGSEQCTVWENYTDEDDKTTMLDINRPTGGVYMHSDGRAIYNGNYSLNSPQTGSAISTQGLCTKTVSDPYTMHRDNLDKIAEAILFSNTTVEDSTNFVIARNMTRVGITPSNVFSVYDTANLRLGGECTVTDINGTSDTRYVVKITLLYNGLLTALYEVSNKFFNFVSDLEEGNGSGSGMSTVGGGGSGGSGTDNFQQGLTSTNSPNTSYSNGDYVTGATGLDIDSEGFDASFAGYSFKVGSDDPPLSTNLQVWSELLINTYTNAHGTYGFKAHEFIHLDDDINKEVIGMILEIAKDGGSTGQITLTLNGDYVDYDSSMSIKMIYGYDGGVFASYAWINIVDL